jgi:hypothetical protein
MSNAFSNAWGWSLRHSPLMAMWRSLRGTIQPNKDAFALLDAVTLPEPVDAVIRTTIARTKLWRDERAQVTRELIAHAQDALDAGRDPKQVADTFGDPRRVARLLRRSMKRKRPLSWQLYRFSRRAVGVMFLVLFVVYIAVVVRFYSSEPDIKVDYAAMLNDRYAHYPQDQLSWPVIMEASLEWSKAAHVLESQQEQRIHSLPEEQQYEHMTGISLFPQVPSDHPDYQPIARAVRDMAPQLAQLRDAAARPALGFPIGYEITETEWNGRKFTSGVIPATEDDFKNRSLMEVRLAHLGPIRQLSNVLIFDARLAIDEGDSARATQNYIAILGLARQARSEPFMISELVGIAIHMSAIREIERRVRDHPGLLNRTWLIELAHVHAEAMKERAYDFDLEQLMFEDLLQRVYSDDGQGDGRLTPEGLEHMGLVMGDTADLGESYLTDAINMDARIRAATRPLTRVFSASRAEESALYNSVMETASRVTERGPEWIAIMDEQELIDAKLQSEGNPIRFSFAGMMTPALGSAIDTLFKYRQYCDAFSLMLGIESYRLEHGRLPDDLDQLSPKYVPQLPQDLMAPGSVIRYLSDQESSGYLLYSVGSDGNDDGGRLISDESRSRFSREEQSFRVRYRQAYDRSTHEPLFEPSGRPVIADPQGPDADWILIDTRPESDDPQAP